MKKRAKKNNFNYLLIIVLIFLLIISIFFIKFTGFAFKDYKKQVQLYFYDKLTNCTLNGYIFIEDKIIGKTENGIYNLSYKTYLDINNTFQNITIFGKLGGCFGNNSEFFFDKSWEIPEIKEYYFIGESKFSFKSKIDIHNPSKREMIGFVEPEKVKMYLNDIEFSKDVLHDLSAINNYLSSRINYINDSLGDYWQTPEETLKINKGDCEEYATTLLSLFLAYNPNLKCYNIVFRKHVTTFCYIQNYFIYYESQKNEIKKKIVNQEEIKKDLLELNKDYSEFILDNKTEALYAFSNMKFFEFKDRSEFIDWQKSLTNSQKNNLFDELEINYSKILENISIEDGEAELGTQKVQLLESHSIGGFFEKYFFIMLTLFVLLIFIFVILMRIRKK